MHSILRSAKTSHTAWCDILSRCSSPSLQRCGEDAASTQNRTSPAMSHLHMRMKICSIASIETCHVKSRLSTAFHLASLFIDPIHTVLRDILWSAALLVPLFSFTQSTSDLDEHRQPWIQIPLLSALRAHPPKSSSNRLPEASLINLLFDFTRIKSESDKFTDVWYPPCR